MAFYDQELLEEAQRLLERRSGQRGRLSGARVRRSISTSYYALFHFLLDEVTNKVAGAGNDMRVRRRILARALTHRGLRVALDKVRGAQIDASVQKFFQFGPADTPLATPTFARNMARCFIDAQTKRESADYDLNEPLSETDGRLLRNRVSREIAVWRSANSKADRDFKHAISILIFLKGQLRQQS